MAQPSGSISPPGEAGPDGSEAVVALCSARIVHPGRACRDRARGRAAGLYRRVVIRGGRGGLLHAACCRRARHQSACGHGDRERLHARTSHSRHHGRRHGGNRTRTILPRGGRRFGADRGSLERRPLRPPRHPRPRDGAVPPLRADRRACGVSGQDVFRRRLPADAAAGPISPHPRGRAAAGDAAGGGRGGRRSRAQLALP